MLPKAPVRAQNVAQIPGQSSWIIGGSGVRRLPLFPGGACNVPEGSPKELTETVALSGGWACKGFLYFQGGVEIEEALSLKDV